MEIITLAGNDYAIGLNWLMLPEKGTFEARVDRLIEDWESKPSHYTAYKPKSQVGLCHAGGERLKKVTALAPLVASMAGEQWVGLFAIGDGKAWMLRIIESVIDPDGDRVMLMEDALEEARRVRRNSGITHQIILDDTEASLRALEAFAQDIDVRAPLKRIPEGGFGKRRRKLLSIAGAAVAVLVGGAIALHMHAAHVAAEKARITELLMHRQMLQRAEAQRARELAPPWDAWPEPVSVVRSCIRYIYDLPIANNGWILQAAGCGFAVSATASGRTDQLPTPSGTLTVLLKWQHTTFGYTSLPSAGSAPQFNPQQPNVVYVSAHITYPSSPSATEAAYRRSVAAAPLYGFAADVGAALRTGAWEKVPGKQWSWIGYQMSWTGLSTASLLQLARELPKKVPGGVVQGVEWRAKGTITVSGVLFAIGLPPNKS